MHTQQVSAPSLASTQVPMRLSEVLVNICIFMMLLLFFVSTGG